MCRGSYKRWKCFSLGEKFKWLAKVEEMMIKVDCWWKSIWKGITNERTNECTYVRTLLTLELLRDWKGNLTKNFKFALVGNINPDCTEIRLQRSEFRKENIAKIDNKQYLLFKDYKAWNYIKQKIQMSNFLSFVQVNLCIYLYKVKCLSVFLFIHLHVNHLRVTTNTQNSKTKICF